MRIQCYKALLLSQYIARSSLLLGGAVASWLVSSTPEQAVRVGALAVDVVLCSWARHLFTLTVPLPPSCINGYRQT